MAKLLCYDPKRRISAEEALKHPWFSYVYCEFSCMCTLAKFDGHWQRKPPTETP